jgi:hypothetical protein
MNSQGGLILGRIFGVDVERIVRVEGHWRVGIGFGCCAVEGRM